MTIVARCVFKLSAPFHSHDHVSRVFEMSELSAEEKAEFMDTKNTKIETSHKHFDVTATLLYGFIQNPLVPGSTMVGFHSVELVVIDKSSSWPEAPIPGEIKEQFREAIFACMNKLVAFMKYKKGHPFLRAPQLGDVTSWTWEDENGNVIETQPKAFILAKFPGYRDSLDSKALRKSDLPKLAEYMQQDHKPHVVDDLLIQAKEAIFEENALLAVLLLAVSVEVRVKTAFLGQSSAASDAFDYSQEKGKIAISPVEFINQIAGRTFNESFAKARPDEFSCIDYLFQCRNKVAHRGVGKYRDKKGNEHVIDIANLHVWWDAVSVLFKWIDEKTSE